MIHVLFYASSEGDKGSCLETVSYEWLPKVGHAAAKHSKRLVPGKTIDWPIVRLL